MTNALWPAWSVLPLLTADAVGVAACLYLCIYGVLYILKPDAGQSRLRGLRFLGIGLVCLLPLFVTLYFSNRLPIAS